MEKDSTTYELSSDSLRAWEAHILESLSPSHQTWDNHLDIRLPELRMLADALPDDPLGDVLEIGCGNGIGSAYFSQRAKSIVASDLPQVDHSAHSIGLEKSKGLFNALGLKDAKIVGCAAENLPFAESSFDSALAIYSLEHLPQKELALKELLRVLRPGGHLIAAVPATCWSVTYPFAFYAELASRTLKRVTSRIKKKRTQGSNNESGPDCQKSHSDASSERVVHDWKSFRKAYPQFPLPGPHGEYKSYFDELRNLTPKRWVRLLEASGGFTRVHATPLSVIPRGMLQLLFGKTGLGWYNRLIPLDRRLCGLKYGLSFAQFICVVGEKQSLNNQR